MVQEVKLRIRGVQIQGEEDEDNVEVVSVGQMCERDGFTCITYEEVIAEDENHNVQIAKNLLKIRDEQVEVIKKGTVASHMIFVPEQTTYTYYSTPMGELEIGIFTKEMICEKKERGFRLKMRYNLEMNNTFISQCHIDIEVER